MRVGTAHPDGRFGEEDAEFSSVNVQHLDLELRREKWAGNKTFGLIST